MRDYLEAALVNVFLSSLIVNDGTRPYRAWPLVGLLTALRHRTRWARHTWTQVVRLFAVAHCAAVSPAGFTDIAVAGMPSLATAISLANPGRSAGAVYVLAYQLIWGSDTGRCSRVRAPIIVCSALAIAVGGWGARGAECSAVRPDRHFARRQAPSLPLRSALLLLGSAAIAGAALFVSTGAGPTWRKTTCAGRVRL